MRLIDADAFIERIKKDPLFPLVEKYGLSGVIENEPTVEAIPVEWLFERVPKIDQVMKLYNTKLIEYIVIMWREENETNYGKTDESIRDGIRRL